MTLRERLIGVLQGDYKQQDCGIPVAAITTAVTYEMMEASGAYWPSAHSVPKEMAILGSMAYEIFGFESVKIPFDVTIEAEALGASVDFGTCDTYPQIRRPVCDDPDKLNVPHDFSRVGRVPVVLEAIRILKQRYDEVPIVCHLMGPFSLASLLFGLENVLSWMVLDTNRYDKALRISVEIVKRYGNLIIDAGADILQFGEAAASGDMVGVNSYSVHIAPYHRVLFEQLMMPTVLHICGNITAYLEHLPSLGVDAISFDNKVDVATAHRVLGQHVRKVGNIDPVNTLLEGTPEKVMMEVKRCIAKNIDVVNPGCALSPRTPGRNLQAMVEAVRSYNKNLRVSKGGGKGR